MKRQLAAEDVPADGEEGGNTFSFDEVTKMLGMAGFAVPKEVNTKDGLTGWLMGAAGGGGEAEEAATEMPMDMATQIGADPTGANPVQMASACRTLFRQLSSIQTQAKATAKDNFAATLESHVSRGAITPADRDEMLKVFEPTGYQLSSIGYLGLIPDGAAGNAFVKKTPHAKQLASGSPQAIPGNNDGRPTDEECRATAERLKKRQYASK